MKQFSTRFLLLLPLLLLWNIAEGVQAQTKKVRLPIGMESADVNYDLLSFGNATAEIVSDPFRTNNKVISANKPDGAETWAGTIVGNAGLEYPIQFSAGNTTFTMDVYSPLAGIKVLVKLENASNGSISVETSATVTEANKWQTLSFDFTKNETGTPALNLSATYNKVVVFMNFGTTGAADGNAVYYYDNISHPPTDNYSGPVDPPSPAVLPVTFDTAGVNYNLVDFGGTGSTIGADPTNAANKVAITTKGTAGELWAGTTLFGTAGFDSKVPLTAQNTKMTLKVYAPHAPIQVRLKLEEAADPTKTVETEATVTQANTWQTLTFDFATPVAGTSALNLSLNYNKASVFFNFGVTGAVAGEKTYYWDDLAMSAAVNPPKALPVTFDTAGLDYQLVDFGGTGSTIGADPTNAANKVAITTKGTAGELWAGTTLFGTAGFDSKVPLTAQNTKMTLKVYAPHAPIQVRLKLEEAADPTKTVETEATVTQANTWQTLTFDFATPVAGTSALNLSLNYNKASVFFNFGVTGAVAGEKTYYWDDLAMSAAVNPPKALPVTFDTAGLDYQLVDFGGTSSTIGADPTNAANKVAITTKGTAGELWAGTTMFGSTGFDKKIRFNSTDTKMTARVYSPHAPIQVRLKVEDAADPTKSVETEATVTQANTWQTLTFDFAKQAEGTAALNLATNYNKASIFFNFGVTGATAGEKTYYWDDVIFVSTVPTEAEIPLAFDLQQNYPNPFNPSTTIPFELNKSGYVKLSVYDVAGRLVAKLVNQPLSAGQYRVSLDASNLNSGMYFYRLEVDQHQVVKKMTLLR